MPESNTADVLGYPISRRGLHGDLKQVADYCAEDGQPARYAAFINPHSIVVAKSDGAFRAALLGADLILPDGVGVLVGAKLLGLEIPERVAGFEFFLAFSEYADRIGGISYFFLGSSPSTLDRIRERLAREFPNIEFGGAYSPPYKAEFSEAENSAMLEAVNRAKPTVLWVGMTAPKQEKWINAHHDRLNIKFAGAIGAVFDFYAGTTKRAPAWSRKLGLEWLLRLLGEPRRLWRRNVVSTPLFLMEVIRTALKQE
jgi:N-acetylglucosaminyldiphosphoundecaprenol N-acetyl-beta-D-mannosaminyltransferase